MKTLFEIAEEISAEIKKVTNIERETIAVKIARKYPVNIYFVEKPMGSGGVGQIKEMKDNSIRVQISYGHGRNNYANCAIIYFP
jgi:hypothetical protein